MVDVFGNSIIGAYTGGVSVKEIYANGVKVWPTSGPVPSEYYIKWWPQNLSGSFVIGGETRWLQDYQGYYSGPFLSVWNIYESKRFPILDNGAFKSTGITKVETNLPYISGWAFAYCSSLISVSMPNWRYVTTAEGMPYIFRECSHLRTVSLPYLPELPGLTFAGCTNLIEVYLPNVSRIIVTTGGSPAFASCMNLQTISVPKLRAINERGMAGCGVSVLELPSIQYIGPSAFRNCSNLDTVYIGPGLSSFSVNAFESTKITSTSGSIYVPISMLLSYKSGVLNYYSNILIPY